MKDNIRKGLIIICFFIQIFCLFDMFITNNKIYYTGIKNKGIDYIVPKRLTEETYEKLGLLMEEIDAKKFEKAYVRERDYFVLNEYSKELEEILIEPEIINYYFYDALQYKSTTDETLGINNAPGAFNVLKTLNEAQRKKYLKEPKSIIKEMSTKTKNEYIYKNIVNEESKFGVSPNRLRDNYISKQVFRMVIDIFLLIFISIIEITYLKNQKVKPFQAIIVFIGLEIMSWNNNYTINWILLGITFIIGIIIYLTRNIPKGKIYKGIMKKLKKIENKWNPSMIWIILTIIITMVNQVLYGLYTSYHIFVGVDAERVIHRINGTECNILLSLLLLIFLYRWAKDNKGPEKEVIKKEDKKIEKKEEKQEEDKKENKKSDSKKKKKKKKKK